MVVALKPIECPAAKMGEMVFIDGSLRINQPTCTSHGMVVPICEVGY